MNIYEEILQTLNTENTTAAPEKEDTLLHFAVRSDSYVADINMAMKDEKYPWLDKEDIRSNIMDRDIIEWKVD